MVCFENILQVVSLRRLSAEEHPLLTTRKHSQLRISVVRDTCSKEGHGLSHGELCSTVQLIDQDIFFSQLNFFWFLFLSPIVLSFISLHLSLFLSLCVCGMRKLRKRRYFILRKDIHVLAYFPSSDSLTLLGSIKLEPNTVIEYLRPVDAGE